MNEIVRRTCPSSFGVGLIYFILAVTVILQTSALSSVATIWPANAVIIACMLLSPRSKWPWLVLASFVANLCANYLTRGTLLGPVLFGAANCIEIAITAYGLRFFRGDDDELLNTPADVLTFGLWAGVIGPASSAFPGAATAAYLFQRNFWEAAGIWFCSDAVGLLLFTPFFYSLLSGRFARSIANAAPGRIREGFALFGLVILTTFACFSFKAPLLWLPILPITLVTFRLGPSWTSCAVVILAIFATIASDRNEGAIAMVSDSAIVRELFMMAYVVSVLAMNLLIASALGEKARVRAQLLQSNIRLSEANQALERFASIASHDLKAPVTSIAFFADAIRMKSGADPEITSHATMIRNVTDEIYRLIDALLSFSRTGSRELQREWIAMDEFRADLLAGLKHEIESGSARIAFGTMPERLYADRQLALQAFRNVVANALKYVAPDTAPLVIIACEPVQAGVASFIITDNGIGIPPQYAEEVFEPLRRLHGVDSRYQGIGLGLALVRTIARGHNGDAVIDTGVASGTRLILSFGDQSG